MSHKPLMVWYTSFVYKLPLAILHTNLVFIICLTDRMPFLKLLLCLLRYIFPQ